MDNKFNKELFSYLDEEDLAFTKKDRVETLNKIQKKKYKKENNNTTLHRIGIHYVGPILGSVMVLILAIGLLLPNLYSGNEISQETPNKQQASQQEDISFSTLLMGVDSNSHRSDINILLTYNSGDDSIILVPIPRDTYVEMFNSEGKMIGKDKLLHATALNVKRDPVLKTVSNLFDISIDYYSVTSIEDFYEVLGVSESAEKDNIIKKNEVGNLLKKQLSFSQFKNLLEESETNIPSDIFNQFQLEDSNSESIQVIDMEEGIEEKFINDVYYVEINQNLLDMTSNTLKQHLDNK
ncbi:LCP family protein [Paraliobacillus zengyii]|uniref:LCP family glycopolymer transferase n=1 Tax=Paraliobacillus zengyii TaxID=2213194 RepID=UPI000DD4A36B|nr:LCP family protein [Paraliobacillus zengyii]